MINQINPNQKSGYTQSASYQKETVEENKKPAGQKESAIKTDTVAFGSKPEAPVTYSKIAGKEKLDASDISALKKMADQANENLRRIVQELILKQSENFKTWQVGSLVESGEAAASDIEKAKLAISEDGEFGVKAVSDRLVNFAISISGGDKTKLAELKAAIDEGFAAAKEALGGYLPDICNETYLETMRKLDAWANE